MQRQKNRLISMKSDGFVIAGHDLNLRPPGYKLLSFFSIRCTATFSGLLWDLNRPKPGIHFFLLHDGFQQSVAGHGAGKDAENKEHKKCI